MTSETVPDVWVVMYTDGASRGNPGLAGAGVAFATADGRPIARGYRFLGTVTNNEAEYRALIIGLEQAVQRGFAYLLWRADSELLVQQVRGEYKVRNANLQELHRRAMSLFGQFREWRAEHIPRELNKEADRLANKAIDLHLRSGAGGART